MADIHHCLRVNAAPEDVFRAVTEDELLRPWWAKKGSAFDVRCIESTDGARVEWCCVDGPPEWVGTYIAFAFAREGRETVVRFAHKNWRETSDAFARCTTKWARVLMALKSRVEQPEADDLHV
jgi:hypothetical protein